MHSNYRDWIERHVVADATGKCADVTAAMAADFPELRRVRGHYFCTVTGEDYTHWWLETAEGDVIDPTAMQFPSIGAGVYREHKGAEPTGICPNCSEYCYTGGTCCSEACERAYAAYCMNPW